MATVFNPNKKDDQEQKQQGVAVAPGAAGSATNVVGGGAPQQPSSQKASSSGRFTNIQNYLNANKGTNLAGQVTGKIQNIAGQAGQQLQQASEAFKQSAEAGKPKEFTQDVYGQLGQAKKVEDVGEAFKQAGEQLNTEYKGPMEIGNQQNIYANQQQLQGLTGATGSAEGRSALLQRFFSRPTYAQGQNRLDTMILGGKQERPQLERTKAISGQFTRDVTGATKEASQQAQQKVKTAEQTRAQSKAALESAKTQQQKDLEAQIEAFNKSEQERASKRFDLDANKQVLEGVSEGTMKMAQALGIDPQSLLRAGATYDAGQASLSNISPEQAAVMNKIAELTGQQQVSLQDKVQAGKYGINEAAISSELAPIYSRLEDRSKGGYGWLTGDIGDTSQLNALGYTPDQLRELVSGAGNLSGITEVWGGYGRERPEDAITDLIRYQNNMRQQAKQQAINNALQKLYKQSGYIG